MLCETSVLILLPAGCKKPVLQQYTKSPSDVLVPFCGVVQKSGHPGIESPVSTTMDKSPVIQMPRTQDIRAQGWHRNANAENLMQLFLTFLQYILGCNPGLQVALMWER